MMMSVINSTDLASSKLFFYIFFYLAEGHAPDLTHECLRTTWKSWFSTFTRDETQTVRLGQARLSAEPSHPTTTSSHLKQTRVDDIIMTGANIEGVSV